MPSLQVREKLTTCVHKHVSSSRAGTKLLCLRRVSVCSRGEWGSEFPPYLPPRAAVGIQFNSASCPALLGCLALWEVKLGTG